MTSSLESDTGETPYVEPEFTSTDAIDAAIDANGLRKRRRLDDVVQDTFVTWMKESSDMGTAIGENGETIPIIPVVNVSFEEETDRGEEEQEAKETQQEEMKSRRKAERLSRDGDIGRWKHRQWNSTFVSTEVEYERFLQIEALKMEYCSRSRSGLGCNVPNYCMPWMYINDFKRGKPLGKPRQIQAEWNKEWCTVNKEYV